jgi:ABC-type multidrug transport system ATPase subunit
LVDAISVNGLTRRFGNLVAVDAVSLSISRGSIFGLMGHNGAGKTTLIRMLLGLTHPSGGSGRVLDLDIVENTIEIRRHCGFLPADFRLPGEMTARQFLRYIASMFDLEGSRVDARIDELIPLFHMESYIDKKISEYSTGMMQKVGLAQALINSPQILLLDEPTAGIDPIGRHEFLELLRAMSHDDGVTILFSTHILSDIESVCESAAILHEGKLIGEGRIDALKEEHECDKMDDLYLKLVRQVAA